MDIFKHRYYRLSKNCMTFIGLWPYQSTGARCGTLAVVTFFAITGSVPQVLAYVKYRDDWKVILDSVVPWLFATMCCIKWIGFLWNSEKTLKLLNRVFTNWQVWAQDQEVNTIHEYAEQGETLSILYTATIYSTVILFTTQPIIPKIIDVMMKNGTEPGKFPYPVDYYFFDAQKYYFYIMMHFYICACLTAMPLVASDTMLIICMQHVCGVFAAMGYKLEQIENTGMSVYKGKTPFELDKRNFADLVSLIDRHNDAIEYANLIDATYTWTFLITIGIGLIMINILGLQILMGTDDPESSIRFVVIVLCLELVFYTECYLSQILQDHSINIGYCINNSRWYRLSSKTQKVLLLMMIRSRVPCQLTAGKMLIMSMSTFGLTFRTAMSYFAVVRNMDDGFTA